MIAFVAVVLTPVVVQATAAPLSNQPPPTGLIAGSTAASCGSARMRTTQLAHRSPGGFASRRELGSTVSREGR